MSLPSRPRFAGLSRNRSATVVFAVLLAVACVGWSVIADRPRQVVSQRRVDAVAAAISTSGCPVTASCISNGSVRASVLALVRREFGSSATVTSSAVVDRSSGRRYDETLLVHAADGVDVAISTRCVAGGAAVPSVRPATVPAFGPADLSAVVPGPTGCSAGVAVHVEAGVAVAREWSPALATVTSPDLQLAT